MATRRTPGTVMVALELDEQLVKSWRNYVKRRRERFRAAMERAIRRDMTSPPSDHVEPLPPAESK